MVLLNEPPEHGAGFARPNDPPIDLYHRNDFGPGSRQEAFIRVEQIITRQVRFRHCQAGFFCKVDDGLAGDAVEGAGGKRRGQELVAFDDENVVAGAFGHEALGVEHDGFLATAVGRLDLGEDVVQVVERFDGRVQSAVQVARGGHGDDFEALAIILLGVKLDLVRDDDDRGVFAAVRVEAERARAAGHDQADVTVPEFVAAAGFDHGFHDPRVRERERQEDGLGGIEQPVDVFLELEHATVVGANAFEHAVPVKQPVIENRNLRVPFAVIFPVNIDLHANRG